MHSTKQGALNFLFTHVFPSYPRSYPSKIFFFFFLPNHTDTHRLLVLLSTSPNNPVDLLILHYFYWHGKACVERGEQGSAVSERQAPECTHLRLVLRLAVVISVPERNEHGPFLSFPPTQGIAVSAGCGDRNGRCWGGGVGMAWREELEEGSVKPAPWHQD